jgi:hypothetical protein
LAGRQSATGAIVVADLTRLLSGNRRDFDRRVFAAGGGQQRGERERERKNDLVCFHNFFIQLNVSVKKLRLKFRDEKENHFAQAGWELLPVVRAQSLSCLVKTSSTDNTCR